MYANTYMERLSYWEQTDQLTRLYNLLYITRHVAY